MKTLPTNLIDRIQNIVSLNVRVFASVTAIARTMIDESLDLVEFQELPALEGITIVKSEQMLGMNGGIVAATAKDFLGRPMVCVDDFFETLSPITQQFILFHEVGHIKNPDQDWKPFVVNQLERRVLLLKGELSPDECFADDYAVAKMGAAAGVFALNEVMKLTSACHLSGTDGEMQLRLDRIQALRKI